MPDISETVLAFLRAQIDSVEQLEILLLLRREAEREWTPEEVGRTLSTHTDSVAARLVEFASAGVLVAKSANGELYYQYRPRQQEVERAVGELAEAYTKYPVRIISLIFSKPNDKIRTFADAFRFRKDDKCSRCVFHVRRYQSLMHSSAITGISPI